MSKASDIIVRPDGKSGNRANPFHNLIKSAHLDRSVWQSRFKRTFCDTSHGFFVKSIRCRMKVCPRQTIVATWPSCSKSTSSSCLDALHFLAHSLSLAHRWESFAPGTLSCRLQESISILRKFNVVARLTVLSGAVGKPSVSHKSVATVRASAQTGVAGGSCTGNHLNSVRNYTTPIKHSAQARPSATVVNSLGADLIQTARPCHNKLVCLTLYLAVVDCQHGLALACKHCASMFLPSMFLFHRMPLSGIAGISSLVGH